MPGVVYIGTEDAKTLRALTFPKGMAVDVEDADFVQRLVSREDFRLAGDDVPRADPVAVRAGKMATEVNLERLGLLAVAKRLKLTVAADSTDQEVADAIMSAFEIRAEARVAAREHDASYERVGEPEVLKVPEDAPGTIPENWENMHWKQRVRLAKDIAPEMADLISTAEDADEVIRDKITPK